MAADLSSTGEAPDQPCQNQNKSKFIKDKHSLILTDIDTKLELSVNESDNLTHDYYEYEQANISIHFGKVLDAMIIFWIPF